MLEVEGGHVTEVARSLEAAGVPHTVIGETGVTLPCPIPTLTVIAGTALRFNPNPESSWYARLGWRNSKRHPNIDFPLTFVKQSSLRQKSDPVSLTPKP